MRRTLVVAALGAVSLTLAAPTVANADPVTTDRSGQRHARDTTPVAVKAAGVVIGQTQAVPASCGAAYTLFMSAEAGPPSFTIPSSGVLTSWSHQALATPGSVRLVVVGLSGVAGHRTVLATSALQAVTVNALNTFPTRIPVAAGSALALQTSAPGMGCVANTVAGDAVAGAANFDPTSTSDLPNSVTQAGLRLNVSAVLEPDVDGDGYGDVTQDACTQSAKTQAACPAPNTKIKQAPPRTSTNREVLVKFKSTVKKSTFKCKLDGGKYRNCSSPYRKKLNVGTHKLKVYAISPFGIVDPKPAKVKFTIRAKH